jgi:hypothetical protein
VSTAIINYKEQVTLPCQAEEEEAAEASQEAEAEAEEEEEEIEIPEEQKTQVTHKKCLSDYVYYLGSARQASDYEKTTVDYLIIMSERPSASETILE